MDESTNTRLVRFIHEETRPIENGISLLGTGCTVLGDAFGGRSFVDRDRGELVIGQDTMISVFGLALGNQPVLPLEGIGDTIVNTGLLSYDSGRASGQIPTVMQDRIGFNTERGGFYLDAVVFDRKVSGIRYSFMGGIVP